MDEGADDSTDDEINGNNDRYLLILIDDFYDLVHFYKCFERYYNALVSCAIVKTKCYSKRVKIFNKNLIIPCFFVFML